MAGRESGWIEREREEDRGEWRERERESIPTIGDQGSAVAPLLQRDGWWWQRDLRERERGLQKGFTQSGIFYSRLNYINGHTLCQFGP